MPKTSGHATAVLCALTLAGTSIVSAVSPAMAHSHSTYSRASLKSVMTRVPSEQFWSKQLSQWYVDSRSDRVIVGLTKITTAARDATHRVFGNAVTLVVAPRPESLVLHGTARRIVRLHSRSNSHTGTRLNDNKPFDGGDEIIDFWKVGPNQFMFNACTSSYAVTLTLGSTSGMLTAGHCGANAKALGWFSGHVTNKTLIIGQKEGTQGNLDFGGKSDAMDISLGVKTPPTFTPFAFVGSDSSHTVSPVTGQGAFAKGEKICTDGVFSGAQICGPTITQTNMCVTYSTGQKVCNIAEATFSSPFCIPGDSGGPVYSESASTIPALGTIGGTITGKGVCFINRLGPALRAVSATLNTAS